VAIFDLPLTWISGNIVLFLAPVNTSLPLEFRS